MLTSFINILFLTKPASARECLSVSNFNLQSKNDFKRIKTYKDILPGLQNF